MKACARKYNVPVPNDQQYGYAFGFGSLNETEEMCRTRGHITVFQCMQRILEQKCRNTADERYLKTIWSFTIDTRRFEQAATYLCKVHNLQIFRRHKNGCLRAQEKKAGICAQRENSTMPEVLHALRSEKAKSYPTSEIYLERLKSILEKYECNDISLVQILVLARISKKTCNSQSTKAKLDCLYNLLRDTCHPDATLLILNYFKETLPPGCVFTPTAEVINTSPYLALPNRPAVPNQISASSNRPRSNGDVMSDFPHGRYVNDDVYYDDRVVSAILTSSAISLLYFPAIILYLIAFHLMELFL
ncbi:hypothetical protein ACTXT7_008362 [Hymenolepis weldensis]